MTKKISMGLLGSMCLFVLLFLFTSNVVFADDNNSVVDLINITVPQSCSVEGIIASGGEHTKTVQNNQYYSEIGTTTFKTYCNDSGGYAIYAIGYSNDEYGNTLMKHSTNSSLDFDTGTNTSGNTSDWSMKLSPVTGTYAPTIHSDTNGAFSAYHIVPNTYTKVVSFPSNTDLPATGVNATGSGFTSTYAAWISATQGAGTYTGKVKYTLVHPSTEVPLQPQTSASGKICYYANASDAIGTMGCQNVASSVTLLASNFSRTGYGFAGWSNKFDYATNPNQSGIKFYGPQEDLSIPDTSIYTGEGKGLSLYAVWVKSQGNIQDTSKVSSICSGLTTAPTDGTANLSSVSALTDQRDNNTYAIAKLADGKCWMIENLRLESTNSDNSTGALAQGYGTSATYGNFGGLADAESANFSNSTTANSLYYSGTQDGTASINIGTTNYPGHRMPRYNNWNNQSTSANRPQNPTTNSATNSTTYAGMYSYGNYYTWHAAIADTTYYSSGDHGTTSLCPTGWRLPIGNQSTATNSFGALSVALGGPEGGATANSSSTPTGTVMSKTFRSYPNNFLYSGNFNTSSVGNRGSNGYYWSSTAYYYAESYDLYLNSSNVRPGTNNLGKFSGISIRCTVSAGT